MATASEKVLIIMTSSLVTNIINDNHGRFLRESPKEFSMHKRVYSRKCCRSCFVLVSGIKTLLNLSISLLGITSITSAPATRGQKVRRF